MHNTMKKEKEASAKKMNTINEGSNSDDSSDNSEKGNRNARHLTSVASSGHYHKRVE